MIPPLIAHEIAMQRQLELIAEAERCRRHDQLEHASRHTSQSSCEVGRTGPLGRFRRWLRPAWPW